MQRVSFNDSETINLIVEALRGVHSLSKAEKKRIWFGLGVITIGGPTIAILSFLQGYSLRDPDGFFMMLVAPMISIVFYCLGQYTTTRVYDFRKDKVVCSSIFSFPGWSILYKDIRNISIDKGRLVFEPFSGKVRYILCVESMQRILSGMALSLAGRIGQPVQMIRSRS